MIWEPFVLALVLGLVVSAGLYFAYLWPSIEPLDEPAVAAATTGAALADIPARRVDPNASDASGTPAPNAVLPTEPMIDAKANHTTADKKSDEPDAKGDAS